MPEMMTENLGQWDLMQRIQELGLTMNDLTLYLDTHLYDTFAIERYNAIAAEYQKLRDLYEQNHGPLIRPFSIEKSYDSWLWALQDFPWDY